MMKKFVVGLLAASVLAVPTAVASPAQAHISTCTVSAYNPTKLAGIKAVISKGRWYCSYASHHEYISGRVDVQYWQVRSFAPDGWATIARTRGESKNLTGTHYATAPCVNPPARRYRTVYTLYMVGAHGVVEKKAYSYGTTISC